MRIVSGKYRGRRLQPPANLPVRPTTDFAKEGLFNVLNNTVDYESLKVLDLFSGTGSIAFEFLSRGVLVVTAVDSNHRCIEFIKKTAADFGATNITAVKSNSFVFLKHMVAKFDLVFGSGLLAEDGMLILEHSDRYKFEKHPCFEQHRNYGSVNFSFFKKEIRPDNK